MQPYIFTNLNYYRLILNNFFIFLDDANYFKKGFINRNTFDLSQTTKNKFVLPIERASQNRAINKHYYLGKYESLIDKLSTFCRHDTHFHEAEKIVLDWIKSLNKSQDTNVAHVNAKSITMVLDALGVDYNIDWSSRLDPEKCKSGEDRILKLCKLKKASTYRNASGGEHLYNQETFSHQKMNLEFQMPCHLDTEPLEFVSIVKVISKIGLSETRQLLLDKNLYWS